MSLDVSLRVPLVFWLLLLELFRSLWLFFDMVVLLLKAGIFTRGATHVKRPPTQFTVVTCSLHAKTGKFTCLYVASISYRIHATAPVEVRNLRVTSHAGRKLTYLHFACEFTRDVIACKITCKIPLIRLCSARGACRVDAGKFSRCNR